jgi:hypothetical protein
MVTSFVQCYFFTFSRTINPWICTFPSSKFTFHGWREMGILEPCLCLSSIWLNILSSPYLANNLKFIHKVRNHKRKAKFKLWIYHFSNSRVMPLFISAVNKRHPCPVDIYSSIFCYMYNNENIVNTSDHTITLYRAQVTGWFRQRSHLGKVDFTFSLVKCKVQVALQFWIVILWGFCHVSRKKPMW